MSSLKNNFDIEALDIALDERSKYLRSLVVKCLLGAGRGHMGSAMSIIEILRVCYDKYIKHYPNDPENDERDRLILSKGHGCLGLYSILADYGYFSISELEDVGSFNSNLGGHPEHYKINGVEASTGALGHGLPIAVGIASALKLKKNENKVIVILGDGEINEGSIWEAAMSASKHCLDNLIVFVDYNKIQSYGFIKEVLDLEPLSKKWESFGFYTQDINGHDTSSIEKALSLKSATQPNVIICHTVKGKGFPFAENNPKWHHKNSFTKEEIDLLREFTS
jgi:transketolase